MTEVLKDPRKVRAAGDQAITAIIDYFKSQDMDGSDQLLVTANLATVLGSTYARIWGPIVGQVDGGIEESLVLLEEGMRAFAKGDYG